MTQLNRWQKELKRLADKQYAKAVDQLQEAYQDALKDMTKKLRIYTNRYEELTFAQKLEAQRLFKVAADLDKITVGLTKQVHATITEAGGLAAELGYYGSIYALEGQYGIKIPLAGLDQAFIDAAVERPVAGLTLSERLWNETNKTPRMKVATEATNLITQGLIQGRSYGEMAKDLHEIVNGQYYESARILRTESGRIRSEATEQAYEEAQEAGVEMRKQWIATLDDRTRDSHAELDGEFADEDGYFYIGNLRAKGPRLFDDAAESINCRCSTIAVVQTIAPELRRTGANEVFTYKTYEQWQNAERSR